MATTSVIDDKSEHCVPFILERIKAHRQAHEGQNPPPFFIGINGVQGAGKTTLVSTLCETLAAEPYILPTAVLSIDDLYLPHEDQIKLAQSHPQNPLVQHRGQPSTHDVRLGVDLFTALGNKDLNVKIPSYDKSAFHGQGDRCKQSEWRVVNAPNSAPIEVVIFEGWCVGFRPLNDADLEQAWIDAKNEKASLGALYRGQLGSLKLSDIQLVNDALKQYDRLTDRLDALVHIDAEDTRYVYRWRQQQEAALRAERGTGMTEEQVNHFVDGYYPAYELYSTTLRKGVFEEHGKQLRLVVGSDRRVISVHQM
ncbi:putative uridine/cytidine kinase [Myriangium duriaei CBS 260.36]|uniref:Uridine/cytidine kinase n=1 Tax=Myriangium duriaei CBS 260.36 TaxID=1168546 RepID=A0A9P4JCD3_9PEZI|nr:putative uridine/cytidine kinase [Myriangium duriaei CBS 260.36]